MSFVHGPLFAGKWKSAWEAKRLQWLGIQTWQDFAEDSFFKSMDFSLGPNGVYNHRHFIFWEEDCDDYKYSLDKPKEANEEYLEDL
jgi:hypothetical protein